MISYPYLIVRLMPAVYPKREIRFGVGEAEVLLDPFWVDIDDPVELGELTEKARLQLMRACQAESKRTGFQLCLVLSPDLRVYFYPSGSADVGQSEPRSTFDC